ncbi:MAG: helix-turn-helix transcriptional regulator [Lachnospiraceae bacterium]|nr:helix-turn-helix transcriptional regulator [Lachnospiraceae bacterium]
MPNITEKTSSNIFFQARCAAAKHNDQLRSREGAADIMSIDRGRLYRIERGIASPHPEEIHLMADLYNAPELENYFCTKICPLGRNVPKADISSLDRISLRAISVLREMGSVQELLIDITADGVISKDEIEDIHKILRALEELEQVTQSLKLWVKKNL